MDQFFNLMAANPFVTVGIVIGIATSMIVGAALIAMTPVPTIQCRYRRRLVSFQEVCNIIGLMGVMMLIISLVVLAVLVYLAPPAQIQ